MKKRTRSLFRDHPRATHHLTGREFKSWKGKSVTWPKRCALKGALALAFHFVVLPQVEAPFSASQASPGEYNGGPRTRCFLWPGQAAVGPAGAESVRLLLSTLTLLGHQSQTVTINTGTIRTRSLTGEIVERRGQISNKVDEVTGLPASGSSIGKFE